MIETLRLTLLPLTLDQLRLHVADNRQLEASLGLEKGHRKVVEPLLSVIVHFTVPRLKDPARDPLYNTIWIAIDRQKRQIVADAKFKGEPDETGTVEIGYGTYPAFQRQGYMAEMVGGLVRWAGEQPGVLRVVADTEAENVASQKVLEKNGFRLFDQIEEMLWWEYVFEKQQPLVFDEYGYLTPYEVQQLSRRTVARHFGTATEQRRRLWQELEKFLDSITNHQIPFTAIWVDGSFVTATDRPNDIDLVIYVLKAYLDQQFVWLSLLSEPFTNLDVKWVPLYMEGGQLRKAIDELEEMKWFLLFSSSRSGHSKGFLSITDV